MIISILSTMSYPKEPSYDDSVESEQKKLFDWYRENGIIQRSCAYCKGRRGGHYISRTRCLDKASVLLKKAGIRFTPKTELPWGFTINVDGIEVPIDKSVITIMGRSQMTHGYIAGQIERWFSMDDVDRLSIELQKWVDKTKSDEVGFVKAGTLHRLEDFEIESTPIKKCKAIGAVNHMNGPADIKNLPSFDWPTPEVLVYMCIFPHDFKIGIAREEHYHGN